MTTRSITVPTARPAHEARSGHASDHPCCCDRASGQPDCCTLDCLTRPRFFCGQLLTDQDLTRMLEWTRDKLRLGRYKQGWGVVRGLDVRCDYRTPGRVIVETGYAVSCCGDDIVVCEPTGIDVSVCCDEDCDPCAALRRTGADVAQAAQGPAQQATAGQSRRQHVVDLYIAYAEEDTDPQAALTRSACQQVSACEPTRTHESFRLVPVCSAGDDALVRAERAWKKRYDASLEVVREYVKHRDGFDDRSWTGERARDWLVGWIKRHPLNQFCALHDWLCDLRPENLASLGDEAIVATVLLWLVQDYRHAFLNCECYECAGQPGVPLARIWLEPTDVDREQRCRVIAIDPYPPYRRPLSPACWPAAPGRVNLGGLIWHRPEEACTRLGDLGVEKVTKRLTPTSVEELLRVLECVVVECDQPVVTYYVGDDDETVGTARLAIGDQTAFILPGRRVVGFCHEATPAATTATATSPTEGASQPTPSDVTSQQPNPSGSTS